QVAHRAPPDVVLADLVNLDRRHDAGMLVDLLERILQRQRVHHGRQHSHVVAGGAVHPGTREAGTAEDVAAADHDRHLDAHAADLGDLPRDPPDHGRIDAVVELAHERLARELQQYAAIEYRGVAHPSCLPRCAAPDGPVAAAGL